MGLNIRIRELRKERGLTIAQLASKINVSTPHLSEVERGLKNLNNHLIERLAVALGVDPAELIGAQEAPDNLSRLKEVMPRLSPEDQERVESFALALLRSQEGPGRSG